MPKVIPEYKETAKKRIIEHAGRMFSEQGYYKTKMTDIAESMNVSKGALYQYFDSKESLLIEVLESHIEHRGQVVDAFLESEGIATLSTPDFFDRMLSLRMGTSALTLDLLREANENETIKQWMKTGVTRWVKGLTRVIRNLQQEGMIRKDINAESLVRCILALRDGLYSLISVGVSISKARRAWVLGMELINESILSDKKLR